VILFAACNVAGNQNPDVLKLHLKHFPKASNPEESKLRQSNEIVFSLRFNLLKASYFLFPELSSYNIDFAGQQKLLDMEFV
jgi:hypothetical protein